MLHYGILLTHGGGELADSIFGVKQQARLMLAELLHPLAQPQSCAAPIFCHPHQATVVAGGEGPQSCAGPDLSYASVAEECTPTAAVAEFVELGWLGLRCCLCGRWLSISEEKPNGSIVGRPTTEGKKPSENNVAGADNVRSEDSFSLKQQVRLPVSMVEATAASHHNRCLGDRPSVRGSDCELRRYACLLA
jgi:hypothetical protein